MLERLREDKYAEEDFRRFMFKVGYVFTFIKPATFGSTFFFIVDIPLLQMLCGTEPYPTDIRAKKYKVDKHFLSKVQYITDKYMLHFLLAI